MESRDALSAGLCCGWVLFFYGEFAGKKSQLLVEQVDLLQDH